MAINFEAANMAGYNNPKIEVFKAVTDGTTITDAPTKSSILDCIKRGVVPFILLDNQNDQTVYMFILHYITEAEAGSYALAFISGNRITGEHSIVYTPVSDSPEYQVMA